MIIEANFDFIKIFEKINVLKKIYNYICTLHVKHVGLGLYGAVILNPEERRIARTQNCGADTEHIKPL